MPANPTEAEVITAAIESRIADVFTALPGVVKSYDAATGHADIQPAIRRPLDTASGAVVFEDLPIVPNVPILFPRGGAFAVTWPLAPGDPVLLVFSALSPQLWRATGQTPADPGDLRRHHLGNAYAIPGVPAPGPALPGAQTAVPALVLEGPEIRLGVDAQDPAGNGAATKAWIDALKLAKDSTGTPITVIPPTGPYASTSSILAPKVKVER